MIKKQWFIFILIGLLVAGCEVTEATSDAMFPANVGDFLRVSGPTPDLEHDGDLSIFEGPDGSVKLFVRYVGEDQVEHALSELPPMATEIGANDALGPRNGVFFAFANEYHAAWANGDWVFVLSATTEAARVNFLAFYGF